MCSFSTGAALEVLRSRSSFDGLADSERSSLESWQAWRCSCFSHTCMHQGRENGMRSRFREERGFRLLATPCRSAFKLQPITIS